MWRSLFKLVAVLTVLLLQSRSLYPFTDTIAKYDAEILLNEEHREFFFGEIGGVTAFHQTTRIKRKVLLNTQSSLEKFNKLYIPTYEDLNYRMTLVKLQAKTIKKSGEEIIINEKHVEETTLPANYPLLYGYKGSVKQLVFSHLSIGDAIEYEYIVRYSVDYSSWQINLQRTQFLAMEYPIRKAVYGFKLGEGMNGIFHVINSDQPVINDGRSYTLTMFNISPVTYEDYGIPENYAPGLLYNIINEKDDVFTDWDKYLKNRFSRSGRNEYFMMGLKLADFLSMISQKKIMGTEKRIGFIRNQILAKYEELGNYSQLLVLHNEGMNMDDISQMLTLIDMLDLDASVLLLRERRKGVPTKDFISTAQFDNAIVMYKGDDGQVHYWEPFNPFGEIDQFPYYYFSTEALRIEQGEHRDLHHSWYTMPVLNASENYLNRKVTIQLKNGMNKLQLAADMQVDEGGQFAYLHKPMVRVEELSKKHRVFTRGVESELSDHFYNFKSDSVIVTDNQPGQLQFEVKFNYDVFRSTETGRVALQVTDLVPDLAFMYVEPERRTTAYLKHPLIVFYSIDLKLPEEGGSVFPNEYFNREIANEVAAFKSKASYYEGGLTIEFTFQLKEAEIPVEKWNQFVAVRNEMKSFYVQKVIVDPPVTAR